MDKIKQREVGIKNILNDIQSRLLKPKEFGNAMLACGFSPDWDLRENELAIVRLAIKHNLRAFGVMRKEMNEKIQSILLTLCNVYQGHIQGVTND